MQRCTKSKENTQEDMAHFNPKLMLLQIAQAFGRASHLLSSIIEDTKTQLSSNGTRDHFFFF